MNNLMIATKLRELAAQVEEHATVVEWDELQHTRIQKERGRPVTSFEALLAARRLINSHFGNSNSAITSIPVRPDDDDVTVLDFIDEVAQRESERIDRSIAITLASKAAIYRPASVTAEEEANMVSEAITLTDWMQRAKLEGEARKEWMRRARVAEATLNNVDDLSGGRWAECSITAQPYIIGICNGADGQPQYLVHNEALRTYYTTTAAELSIPKKAVIR